MTENINDVVAAQQKQIDELTKLLAQTIGDGTKVDYSQFRTAKLKIFDGKIAVGLEPYANGDKVEERPIAPGVTKTEFYYKLQLKDLVTGKITVKTVTFKEMKMDNTNIVAKITNGKVNKKGILVMNPADVVDNTEIVGSVSAKKVEDKEIKDLGVIPAEVSSVEIFYELEFIDKKFPDLLGKTVRVDSSALNM